jgi:predicted phosphodiesterase
MRVIALYDIHGNLDALEAVLADPRALAAGADAVVVGGDAVPGAFAPAVLDRLADLGVPTHWLRGNGEREVAEEAEATTPPDRDDVVRVTAARTLDALGAARARPLGDLPLTLALDGVLFCHATPRHDADLITRATPDDRVALKLQDVQALLVVAGHTHQQDDRTLPATGVRLVNAGSVGMPYEGDGAARWLVVEDGVPALCSTAYDAPAAGRRILASGWPDAESITAALIDPVDPQVVTDLFEARA